MRFTLLRTIATKSPWQAGLRRGLWLLVLLAHGPALGGSLKSLVASGFAADQLVSSTALLLSVLLFVGKVLDLPWLRVPRTTVGGVRSYVAIGMIVALLHVNVFGSADDRSLIVDGANLVTATVLLVGLPLIGRVLRHAGRRFQSFSLPKTALPTVAKTVWFGEFRPHCWSLILRLFHLRAPPSCA